MIELQKSIPDVVVRVHREDVRGNVYTLTNEIRWLDLVIPAGFESDGASVPRFFWRVVFPPGDSRALFAALVHDYIYRNHPNRWTKSEADALFYDLLVAGGIPKIRAWMAYQGVKWFGGSSWAGGENAE